MKDQLPDYWSMLKAYHHAREGLYRTIITDCRLPPAALILDAACGDAFYSDLLATIIGPQARIVAADYNLATLRSHPLPIAGVQPCLTDVERAGLRPGSFDVVWMCRSMHSVIDPQQRVAALAALLRPGGRLIVIENDLAHCPILAWPVDFEQHVQQALDRFFQQQCSNGASIDRYYASRHLPAWLAHAGLRHITLLTYPVEDVVPLADDVETYWRLWMNLRGSMIRPFLSSTDWQTYSHAFDPDSPDYVLNRPGFYCIEPTTVACGIAQ
jgi:SAM-dependent methyltransferase